MAKPLQPDISVIVTSYNNWPHIKQALASTTAASRGLTCEIIVVDDHSSTEQITRVRELKGTYDFKLLELESNKGPSAARNLGLSVARGKYINFLDGDDYILPEKLSVQLHAMELSPAIDVCYCDSFLLEGQNILAKTLNDSWPARDGEIFSQLLLRNCLALHSALIKADIAKRVRFDETLRNAEDYKFWLTIAKSNHHFKFINDPLVVYRITPKSLSKNVIPARNQTLKVLAEYGKQPLTSLGRKNLLAHRYTLLYDQAATYFGNNSAEGMQLLGAAAKIKRLPPGIQLSLRLMRLNFRLGLLCYRIVTIVSRYYLEKMSSIKERLRPIIK